MIFKETSTNNRSLIYLVGSQTDVFQAHPDSAGASPPCYSSMGYSLKVEGHPLSESSVCSLLSRQRIVVAKSWTAHLASSTIPCGLCRHGSDRSSFDAGNSPKKNLKNINNNIKIEGALQPQCMGSLATKGSASYWYRSSQTPEKERWSAHQKWLLCAHTLKKSSFKPKLFIHYTIT